MFACISPWNFPLAIFTGQVAAALAAGNAVIAKPAEQTPLIAARAVELLHQAGVPGDVLHLLPGGAEVGARWSPIPTSPASPSPAPPTRRSPSTGRSPRATARSPADRRDRRAERDDRGLLRAAGAGGRDVVTSAFNSAGQRCSALRVLFVQEDIAARVIEMLAGAMAELRIGDPACSPPTSGPVIDAEAQAALERHRPGSDAGRADPRDRAAAGMRSRHFVAPLAVEIPRSICWRARCSARSCTSCASAPRDLDAVARGINRTGYGLTLGIHTRIESQAQAFQRRCASATSTSTAT